MPRETMLADLCRQLLADAYAPAAVLIDRSHEILYSMGPTHRYLHMAKGVPTRELVAMTAPELRAGLKSALRKVKASEPRVVSHGIKMTIAEHVAIVVIDVRRVAMEGEEVFLVCFVEEPFQDHETEGKPLPARGGRRLADLERELEIARSELRDISRDLELSNEEQRTINEEALSVNEEYQSTNEELLTSKEELQSLNEELTALNGQLQETLERQRTTSDDLQNVLYSTDVATLFLDIDLNIRFFTPATKSLFRVIPGDVGRPLADLASLASDANLPLDARAVLRTLVPIDREVEVPGASWFNRRILPYRAHDDGVEGVVITFTDITDRKLAATALEAARREADRANLAKSRFLAAASHDLRQPLQSLVLLQGLLAKTVDGDAALQLVTRMDHTLGAMSGMLNTLLDIKQIEAGVVRPDVSDFAIDGILERLHEEFAYQAESQGLDLRRVPCSAHVRSDPALLEQMMRNLVSNALKYTKHGKALIGCRRRAGVLHIEVWDTGLGIAEHELQAIFEEYHQVANPARERSRGLGLGLPIVQRLGQLLEHKIRVRSTHGKGSVFLVEVPLAHHHAPSSPIEPLVSVKMMDGGGAAAGTILVVEDDPDIRDLLQLLLSAEGYGVTVAAGASEAVAAVAAEQDKPTLLLADYNLPGGMDGLEMAARLRTMVGGHLPAIILTGDISTRSLQQIAHDGCAQLNKPVKPKELFRLIRRLLLPAASPTSSPADEPFARDDEPIRPVVFVVDDDEDVREAIRCVLEADGRVAELYATSEAFLGAYRDIPGSCLLVDAYLPRMSGLDLLRKLRHEHPRLPAIMITGSSDVSTAVTAMKAGASDFIEKPISGNGLLASLDLALERSRDGDKSVARQGAAAAQLVSLTPRQREIMDLVLSGHPSKNIAADLGISRRTVENHRAAIMTKTGSKSLPELVRLALHANVSGDTAE
ncbi:MAG: response regulator [Rhizobiaceae bacterium]|nr:response regulator [Rhizobiaceae bacterium]